MNQDTHAATRLTSKSHPVDNTDWLKTAAIILVAVDHIGYFFIEDAQWWNLFGRMAAPVFFFLLGFAHTRSVPLRWILLGVILTLLESWNASWTWVTPNILLSLALIRLVRPYVQNVLQHHGWAAFTVLVAALLAIQPIASKIVDYGSEGWLWALFGLYQRMYVDSRSAAAVDVTDQIAAPSAQAPAVNASEMRLLACFGAAIFYVWQEQREFFFSQIQFAVLIFCIGALSLSLSLFMRGPSFIQPPQSVAGALRFIGRHTLEIYFIQLAGSELIIKLVPDLAP